MDLVLGPATRLLWRGGDAIHLEMGSRSVVVEGLAPLALEAFASAIRPAARAEPMKRVERTDGPQDEALDYLAEAGYLWARPTAPDDSRFAPPRPRLAGELTSLAARHGTRAAELLHARRHSSVVVHGSGRAAVHLAALLAAAGVGRVRCVAQGTVRLTQATPGGVLPGDEGAEVAGAADAAVLRAAPEADTTPLPPHETPDLTVLAQDTVIDEQRRIALHADGAAHLVLRLGVEHAVIGPLVIPGLTSCLRCADLGRRDRDPAWPALAAQLAVPRRYGAGSDVVVATIAVGAAAMQALAFLDGDDPATVDGTLELHSPDWRLRRRSWTVHPDCDCAQEASG